MRALPSCSCGRPMMPVIEGRAVFPGFAEGLVRVCSWCDLGQLTFDAMMALCLWSEAMWTELEMLERGSWPARIQGLLPQVDPPADQS